MYEVLAKYVGGKVLTALIFFGLACAGYWFYNHPEDLRTLWGVIKYTLAWLGFAAVFPWATFFVTRWVMAKDSNAAAAVMLVVYLLIDVIAALCFTGVRGLGALTWVVLLVGFLAAGVYNFLVCEYQSERFEDA